MTTLWWIEFDFSRTWAWDRKNSGIIAKYDDDDDDDDGGGGDDDDNKIICNILHTYIN